LTVARYEDRFDSLIDHLDSGGIDPELDRPIAQVLANRKDDIGRFQGACHRSPATRFLGENENVRTADDHSHGNTC
jgi:hypothetical protein